jgi:hypothetical protein
MSLALKVLLHRSWMLVVCTLARVVSVAAQPQTAPDSTQRQTFDLEGYGVVNYHAFDWDTDPDRRNVVDLERLTLYPSYAYSDHLALRAEVEVEHGGTGVTMEFDRFEEFGEFEVEVEKGGEVLLEQLYLEFRLRPALSLRIGRFKLPVGVAAVRDEPNEYLTAIRSEAEASIIPTNWYENGVQVLGWLAGGWRYQVSLVNGLDGTGFSSARWVAGGTQKRFETVNAEDPALAVRIDRPLGKEGIVGVSGYAGNTTGNRPKPDLDARAVVFIGDVHAVAVQGAWRGSALLLYGHLQNADLVSQANRNLSNNLNVKRTPVGSVALGAAVELGYDVLAHRRREQPRLWLFGRTEFYDTMYRTTGEVFDNPRWQRTTWTGGVNLAVRPEVVLKAQAAHRRLGSRDPETNRQQVENTLSMGFGFVF